MTKIDVCCFLVCLAAYSWAGTNAVSAADAEKSKSVLAPPRATVSGAAAKVNATQPAKAPVNAFAVAKSTKTATVSVSAGPEKIKPGKVDATAEKAKPANGKANASATAEKAKPANGKANPAPTVEKTKPGKVDANAAVTAEKAKPANGKANPAPTVEKTKPKTTAKATSPEPDKGKDSVAGGPEKIKEQPKSQKTERAEPRRTARHPSGPGMGLVPPPPPETPTILAVPGGMFQSVAPYEMSPANLAQRKKELTTQLASAEKLLDVKTQHCADSKGRAEQFKSLFSEGVISKRELDNAQTEAESSVTEMNDAKLKVTSLQNTIARVDDRLSPKSTVAKGLKNQKSKKIAQSKLTKKNLSVTATEKKGGG